MIFNPENENSVVVILKVIERCNINCTYCYFFNGIDISFKDHAARMSLATIEKVAAYFKEACELYNIKLLRFDFHGGEPLLLKPSYLSTICDILINALSAYTKLEFTLQTNGMLINEAWIELFNRYHINIGISIDGPADYHDKYRIDHKGKGTYYKTEAAIGLLRKHAKENKLKFGVGALCVINPEFSARKIYRHFVDDLKLNSFDFLLPDNTWDSLQNKSFNAIDYGLFLSDVFDEWVQDNNPKIFVRVINTIMSHFLNTRLHFHDFGGWIENFLLITINSNGGIGPDDTYRSANPELMQLNLTVYNSNFSNFLKHTVIENIINSAKQIPQYCKNCTWLNNCKGGSLLHRYSSKSQFDNPSVYCDGLKHAFMHINTFIKKHEIKMVKS